MIELHDELMGLQEKKGRWDPAPGSTHVHFVCSDSFAGSMKQALQRLGWSETHKVVTLRENYAIGPLKEIDTLDGWKHRSDWFRDHIAEAWMEYHDPEEEYKDLMKQVGRIPDQATVIIWTSGNTVEQIGMRHAAYLLLNRRDSITLSAIFAIVPFIISELLLNVYRINRITGIPIQVINTINLTIIGVSAIAIVFLFLYLLRTQLPSKKTNFVTSILWFMY